MACHPSGIVVDIAGINDSSDGRSCEEHECCGTAVAAADVAVRFRTIQLPRETDEANPRCEATAIAVHHVTDGVDGRTIGFLRRHSLKHKDECDGRLAQITEVFNDKSESPSDRAKHHRNCGCCSAVLIEAECRESPTKKKQKADKQTMSGQLQSHWLEPLLLLLLVLLHPPLHCCSRNRRLRMRRHECLHLGNATMACVSSC